MSGVVFFGTPDFAVPSLEALCRAGRRPQLVISQPDRPSGRGGKLTRPAVAVRAEALELPLAQPLSVRDPTFLERLRGHDPDWCVVVAFGQIFRSELLDLPRRGCLNVHASLLPAYRGAAPIQAALAAGERTTGVSIMRMDEGLDSGPVVLEKAVAIEPLETAPALSARLADLGGEALIEALEGLESGRLVAVPQDDERATYAPRLRRQDGEVRWTLAAAAIHDRLRAFTPWPGLFAPWAGERLKILEARPYDGDGPLPEAAPGTIVGVEGPALLVRCGEGTTLAVETVQRPGRRPASGAEFLRGAHMRPGGPLA